MKIEIIGAESLGVRSLCTAVRTRDRNIVIDPGVALGFKRHGLMPHPAQVIATEKTKELIVDRLRDATDVVISHYHGDHHPLVNANPYQLSAKRVVKLNIRPKFWTKGTSDLSLNQFYRARNLAKIFGRTLHVAEGVCSGPLSFSLPVLHGERDRYGGNVMMTRIEENGEVFVHASDIQMLDDEAIERILDWKPNIVLASGPPIYLPSITFIKREEALRRALHLAEKVDTLILDHHLMRSKKGEQWLDYVSSLTAARHRIVCAADFMECPRNLLEAERIIWYRKLPVPDGWHNAYARGEIDVIRDWSDRVAQTRVR